ncbi:MAG: XRE family transcriptional regulator [Betaproteobacteria bacterium]|jgi:predicted XRE-type DNA-binding protein|nr:XRE family transcriptional regulator [Betaproteobacteria bacterium]
MKKRRFENIWNAIEVNAREAANLRARSELMIALQEHLRADKLTQARAAKLLGVTQPRVSDLMRGKIDLFSLETLIDMLARVGAHVKLSVRFSKRAA